MAHRPYRSPLPESRESSGSRAGLELLYRNHFDWLRQALRFRLRGASIEIDDIVQDTYVRVSRYPDRMAHDKPRALLLRIALNLARDQFRKQSHLPANDGVAPQDLGSEGDQEYLLALKQTILDLPPEIRRVFLLSRFTAMSNAQIAMHLGVSVKTVEYRMHKAMILCAQRLDR